MVSPSNEAAAAAIDAWPNWPGGRLALIGPEGSGKTHLARAWAAKAGAAILDDKADVEVSSLAGRAVLAEDADRLARDETLFHLINMADAGATLLVTGRTAPSLWRRELPDLRSRLNALTVARIEAPDDAILAGVMLNLFRERNIKPAEDVIPYLVQRIERSIPAAKEVVRRIDEFADAGKREVTRALARQILTREDNTLDLFD